MRAEPKPKKLDGRRARREATERKILAAVGRVIAEEGLDVLGVNAIAKAAGVDKVLLYRYFGDLNGLLRRYAESVDFWPDLDEILGTDRAVLQDSEGGRIASQILINYARALRRRPATLQLLAWECYHRNELTIAVEESRERWTEELVREIKKSGVPIPPDLQVHTALLSAALNYLAIRGRQIRVYSGIEVGTEKGWTRIEAVIRSVFGQREQPKAKRPSSRR